jgi:hypothetical protein
MVRRATGGLTAHEGVAVWRAATAEHAKAGLTLKAENLCQSRRTGKRLGADTLSNAASSARSSSSSVA